MNIKNIRTAARVADMLAAVEAILVTDGRPRKFPGKDRHLAVGVYGQPIARITPKTSWDVDKVSLVGAFQLARINAGASKPQMLIAMRQFYVAYRTGSEIGKFQQLAAGIGEQTLVAKLTDIDNHQLDTRRLARDARTARRYIEKNWPVDEYLTRRREVNA